MSEASIPREPTDCPGIGRTLPSVSAGAALRAQREAAGMALDTMASSLKVPVAKLEALECDNWSVLSDPVFVRALAASVCRKLKTDPAPILALLPAAHSPRLATDDAGINAPIEGPQTFRIFDASLPVSRTVVWSIAVLLLAALALLFLPPLPESAGDGVSSDHTKTPLTEAEVVTPPAQVAEATPVASLTMPMQAAQIAPVAAPEPKDVSPAKVAQALPQASEESSDLLRIRVHTGASWVQVNDADGVQVLQRSLGAGESVFAKGKLPLRVVVGNVGSTEVLVRGQPLALEPLAKNNVARFEVK